MFFFFFWDSVLIWPNLKKFLSDDSVCFCCLALHTVLFKHLLLSFCPQIKNPLPTILFFLLHLPIILLFFFFVFYEKVEFIQTEIGIQEGKLQSKKHL